MKKRILSTLLAICLIVTLLPTMALAADASGTSGGIDWSYDAITTTLAISAAETPESDSKSGVMPDYENANNPPWVSYKEQITSIVIKPGVTNIGKWAFSGNPNLSSIAIPEGVTSIGEQSVRDNPKLTTVSLPSTVTTIGNYWMQGNNGITSFSVAEDNTAFTVTKGILFSDNGATLFNYPAGATATSYVIPDTVTKINYAAFHSAGNLTSVMLPENLTELGRYSFAACTKLSEITIPASVSKIDNQAFNGCTALSSVTLKSGLTEIAQKAFMNCTALTQITFPETLKTIGTYAFQGSGLTSVEIPASVSTMTSAFEGATKLRNAIVKGSSTTARHTQYLFKNCTALQVVKYMPQNTSFMLGTNIFADSSVRSIDLSTISEQLKNTENVTNGWLSDIRQTFIVYTQQATAMPVSSAGLTGSQTSAPHAVNAVLYGGYFDSDASFSAGILTTPKKDGYFFEGWYTSTNHGFATDVKTYLDPDDDDGLYYVTAPNTYYAEWFKGIKFDPNGGTGEIKKQPITDDDTTTTLTANTFTRAGYTFAGWNTKPDGTGKAYADEATAKLSGGTTLYAQWEMGIGDSGYTVDAILDQTYTGAEIKPDVVVRGSDGVRIHENNYTVEYSNNKNVGTASVTVTMGEKSATVNFTIVKDNAPTVSISDVSVTYGTAYTLTPVAKTAAGVEITGENIITIKYYTNEACNDGETDTAPANAGTYWAKATLTGTDNYAEVSDVAKITISNATFAVSAEGWSGPYDGNSHSITVTADGATITYCAMESGEYTATNPQYTNAGTYTVYYKVSKANHNDVTGSVNVEISKIDPVGLTVTANGEASLTMTGGGKVTIEAGAHPEGITPTITCSPAITPNQDGTYTLPNKAQAYTFTASYAASTNYNAYEVSCLVVVSEYVYYPVTPSFYTVTVNGAENGDISVSHASATSGTVITVSVDPDAGYELDKLTVTNAWGREIDLKAIGGGKYTFTMPSGNVSVTATFKEIPIVFTDVYATDYYYDAVYWAVANGVTNGTSTSPATFSPLMDCTRAQAVTFLWRAAGSPEPTTTVNPFTDVPESEYYYKAVLWAVENGITYGTNEGGTTFSPNLIVTRAQVVTMLYRLAGEPAVTGSSGFSDVPDTEYYAAAVQWAVANGITYGTGTNPATFSPDLNCDRSQIVTFLYRHFVK